MLLFSTLLSIHASMTPDDFIQLVLEWNRTSSYDYNVIPGIEWHGEHTVRYGNDTLWLALEEYQSRNILAARYEKVASDGVVWDTDYVMNFEERKMAVRLERSYLEEALSVEPAFSTPHFITLLIQKGYLESDGDLPVLRTPMVVGEDGVNLLADVINGKCRYRLPVVYISRTYYNALPVDAKRMAGRLKGVAHVLVQGDGSLNPKLAAACEDKNERYGAIGIYYPSRAVDHKRFLYRVYEGSSDDLMEKVIRDVIEYCNAQMVDALYTWQGVSNALLRENLEKQQKERMTAELAREQTQNETDALIASVDEDLNRMKRQVEELTRANEALLCENQGLRAKLRAKDEVPILYLGEEEELFQGEIREMILDALSESLEHTAEKTRRADVLNDILQNNHYENIHEQRERMIKNLFRDYKTMSGTLRQELQKFGFTITEDGKHYRLTYYGDDRYHTTVSKTASDRRSGMNTAADIVRVML
ncbi:MAG: hypothetical protein LUD16_05530 [Lachnospiraceae bacterium]|nr:hypothetical protein [Lachnospiraceae bacterium]